MKTNITLQRYCFGDIEQILKDLEEEYAYTDVFLQKERTIELEVNVQS